MDEIQQRRSLFGPGGDFAERLEQMLDTLRAISSAETPEDMVATFGDHMEHYISFSKILAVSRRDEPFPRYRITRFSGWEQQVNPWTQRNLLPTMEGGLLGEMLHAGMPRIIHDLVVPEDDPASDVL